MPRVGRPQKLSGCNERGHHPTMNTLTELNASAAEMVGSLHTTTVAGLYGRLLKRNPMLNKVHQISKKSSFNYVGDSEVNWKMVLCQMRPKSGM